MSPISASIRRHHRLLLCLLLSLACAGCAPQALLGYRADAPLTANLPLGAAPVRDARAAFAPVFERELHATDPAGDVNTWLHTSAVGGQDATAALAGIDRRFAERRARTAVLVVPGLLGDCVDDQSVPFGDGELRERELEAVAAYAQYADLGLQSIRMLRMPGRAPSEANGAALAAALREAAAHDDVAHIVLVGYSKGTSDALHALAALEAGGGVPQKVSALVSVAGAVMGTPLADHYEALYDGVSSRVSPFGCSASAGGELASLTRRERAAWLAAHRPPPSLAYHSVVAFAAPDETAAFLRRSQSMLAAIDPRNDGQMVAADAMLPGSALIAAARADHWSIALPLERNPHLLVRAVAPSRPFPRPALFRAIVKWAVGTMP
ncbi:MAG: hypothetical protein E6Q92_12285 [Burkholderiaceae bacterium]|jgi:hypothetical protein|nr:MAG: hypothetical protein E6Q92_12285 [Burkholderiaceae bacterium]